MTQSELNSIPLYSKVRAFWGNIQLDGYLIGVLYGNAVIYMPSNFGIIENYPASGITLIEEYSPDYREYSKYDLETLPMFSTLSVLYGTISKTGVLIDKSFQYNQVYVFYADGSAEWVNIEYVSFISAPAKLTQPVSPPEDYTPGVQPPGEIKTSYPDDQEPEPEIEPKTDTTGTGESKTGVFAIGIIIIAIIALIK
jgi:hypothetical protein